jgi:glutamate decarboxylase
MVQKDSPETREFLQKLCDLLIDYVEKQNDRNEKILDFHHPADMKQILDLEIPEQGVTLQQLLVDCAKSLKYQVKTGKQHLMYVIFPVR